MQSATDTAPRHTRRKAPAPRMSTSPPKKTSRRAAHRASGGVVRRATGRLLPQPQDVPSGLTTNTEIVTQDFKTLIEDLCKNTTKISKPLSKIYAKNTTKMISKPIWKVYAKKKVKDVLDTFLKNLSNTLKSGGKKNNAENFPDLDDLLEKYDGDNNKVIFHPHVAFLLQKPNGPFEGLKIQASENEKTSGASDELYENTMVGLSVRHKKISGLQEPVNITMILNIGINETRVPRCVFYNVTTHAYSSSGCVTLWERGQEHITCSCDHLTYFGVLMVSAPLTHLDQEILTYISQISCSLSVIALVFTVLIFITNRSSEKMLHEDPRQPGCCADLLNLHFLPSHIVAAQSSNGLCLYMALFLHYSLLATFSWMALEGFHIYLLIVKVFNIYIKKYMLKLALVGWGIPAIIVALVVIIDRDAYGRVALNSSEPNSTAICYIANDIVKVVTTMGVFGLVFIFNMIMFGLTVRRVVSLHHSKEFGTIDFDRAKRDTLYPAGCHHSARPHLGPGLILIWLPDGSWPLPLLHPELTARCLHLPVVCDVFEKEQKVSDCERNTTAPKAKAEGYSKIPYG
ncbi:unnamed protein product [Pleuronectes platessa]|uniref:Uncharacterized protein n=1 Tax=Pleuronectes platessa TaxID=8262 RepID=A0A9N7YPP0_PLEPL|nr:unnamed protein product [Pleuronectes platessa]